MRKKKQEMLKTQIECQKVTLLITMGSPLSAIRIFLSPVPCWGFFPGFNKPLGEDPRDETRGEGQHYEDSEGVNREDRTAAE